MYEAIEAVAQEANCTKSELIQKVFRHYQFLQNWRLIRCWGQETAERLGIETDEEVENFLG
jgi:hypothetical protein